MAPGAHSAPGATSMGLWPQRPGGGKQHRQFGRTWCWPDSVERSSGRRGPAVHDGDGLYRGRPGGNSSAAAVETSAKVPPIARLETA